MLSQDKILSSFFSFLARKISWAILLPVERPGSMKSEYGEPAG
jgi:hypothetical protein